jgi:hypothetical protein
LDFWNDHINVDVTMLEPPEDILNPGDVHVQKHPFANTPPTVSPRVAKPPATLPPYWPFKTKQEYKQAALFVKTGSSISTINEQLEILHDVPGGHPTISYKNAEELHKRLDLPSQFDESQVMPVLITSMSTWLTHPSSKHQKL